jgi:hypothetical protein
MRFGAKRAAKSGGQNKAGQAEIAYAHNPSESRRRTAAKDIEPSQQQSVWILYRHVVVVTTIPRRISALKVRPILPLRARARSDKSLSD